MDGETLENVKSELKDLLKDCKKLCIMGVGNTMKGDDGFGVYVVEKLAEYYNKIGYDINPNNEVNIINDNLVLLNCGVVPENFTDVLKKEKPSHILILDAALMGEKPGTLKIVDSEDIAEVGFLTHALPMTIIIKYITHYINTEILVIGIEPKNLDFGGSLSNEIKEKASQFTKVLINIISNRN